MLYPPCVAGRLDAFVAAGPRAPACPGLLSDEHTGLHWAGRLELEKAFGVPAGLWLTLENDYQAGLERSRGS
jgi:hypothetical protein